MAQSLGLTRGWLRHAELSHPAYGVRSLDATEDLTQLAEAMALALPEGTAFSHLTAARLLGLSLPRRWTATEPLHVMNLTSGPMVRRTGCVGHRGLESRRSFAARLVTVARAMVCGS